MHELTMHRTCLAHALERAAITYETEHRTHGPEDTPFVLEARPDGEVWTNADAALRFEERIGRWHGDAPPIGIRTDHREAFTACAKLRNIDRNVTLRLSDGAYLELRGTDAPARFPARPTPLRTPPCRPEREPHLTGPCKVLGEALDAAAREGTADVTVGLGDPPGAVVRGARWESRIRVRTEDLWVRLEPHAARTLARLLATPGTREAQARVWWEDGPAPCLHVRADTDASRLHSEWHATLAAHRTDAPAPWEESERTVRTLAIDLLHVVEGIAGRCEGVVLECRPGSRTLRVRGARHAEPWMEVWRQDDCDTLAHVTVPRAVLRRALEACLRHDPVCRLAVAHATLEVTTRGGRGPRERIRLNEGGDDGDR